MEEFLYCHRPIAQALDILQGNKVASYGFLLPTLISIKIRLMKCQKLTFQYCKNLVSGLITALETLFKNIFKVVEEGRNAAIAAAIHLQFKLKWLKSLLDHTKINTMEALKEAITTVVNNDNQRYQEQANDQVDNIFFLFTPHPDHTTNGGTVLGTWDQKVIYNEFGKSKRTDCQLFNDHPMIKQLSFKFNNPLASSASVEKMFSYATLFNLAKFNGVNEKNFEIRVIIKCNGSALKKSQY